MGPHWWLRKPPRHSYALMTIWANICHATWPSTSNPLIRHVITPFTSCHRSFYADSSSNAFPRHQPPSVSFSPLLSPSLISAVDIYYNKKNIISKVLKTGTESGLGSGSQFHVELLELTERLTMPGKLDSNYLVSEAQREKKLTSVGSLLTPPRAVNLTSVLPVWTERNWTTWDIEVHYGTILSNGTNREMVECEGWAGEDLCLKQVSLEVVDLDENKLGWTDGLVVLHETINSGVRRKRGSKRKWYDEFADIKRTRKLWRSMQNC